MKLPKYVQKVGGQTAFAKKLGVTQGLIWQWLNGKTKISAEWAIKIERVSEGECTREEILPKIFGKQAA